MLDLSNNRLTSMNLDLFMFIGHHNIRLRQLSIAHNWWSCQCNSINGFRQILKQKFLVNGGVNIVDRHQLRCYYNSTTVGPLILDGVSPSSSSVITSSSSSSAQQIFGSFLPTSAKRQLQQQQQQQQQLLTEINQCSELLEDKLGEESDSNPPIPMAPQQPIAAGQPSEPADAPQPGDLFPPLPADPMQTPMQPDYLDQTSRFTGGAGSPTGLLEGPGEHSPIRPAPTANSGSSVPLASFIVVSVLFACVFVVAISVFVFVRQQQQRYHNPHHHHHKKSSAASTTSISSSASSTALSTGASQQRQDHHQQQHHSIHQHGLSKFGPHDSHHASLTGHFEHNFQQQQQLIMGASNHHQQHTLTSAGQIAARQQQQQLHHNHHHHHQHSASSQSNIYATLVPSSANANSTTITSTNTIGKQHQHQQRGIFADSNLYSNHSTTASHISSSGGSHNGTSYMTNRTTTANSNNNNSTNHWHQQPLYGSQMHAGQLYGQVSLDNPYGMSATYKQNLYQVGGGGAGGSLEPGAATCQRPALIGAGSSDWISLPKVKQLMSKLVNKSLALGGYRASNSRDELSNIASDKIYDAFLSYDKRDEPFVQRFSAELEYGSPQYRVADRYRDLPLPSSAYIAEAITSVIGCSHRTIIVLSENYLANDWCRYELQAALRETAIDKSHRLIVVVSDARCLQKLDGETRSLLAAANLITGSGNQQQNFATSGQNQHQQQQQLVQLADTGSGGSPPADYLSNQQQQHQLVTTLTNLTGANQQICTQSAGARVTFINYNERNFSTKIRQLMPVARPSSQTLTLTTKN